MTKRRKRRARVVREEPEEVLEELDELKDDEDFEDEPEEEVPSPPKRKRRKVVKSEPEAPPKRKRKVEDRGEVGPELEPEPVSSDGLLNCLLEGIHESQPMTITRTSDTEWVLAVGGVVEAVPTTQKLSGKAYRDEVRSQDFRDHQVVWKELSFEEKVAQAEKLKVKWAEHDDPRVEVMRVTAAVRKQLGIEKYKLQYRSRAARAAIRA